MEPRDFLWLGVSSGAFPTVSVQEPFFHLPTLTRQKNDDVNALQRLDMDVVLIACGGAGIEMAKGVDKQTYGINRIVALDTDKNILRRAHHCDAVHWVRKKDGREAKSADEAWEAAEEQRTEIAKLVGTHRLAIIVTGLGGKAGFGLPHMAALCARSSGAITLAFATLPLAYECNDAAEVASASVIVLNDAVHNLLIYDHRIVDRCLPANSRFTSTYEYAVLGLRQYLWNSVGCLTRQGMVGVDFEDWHTVFCHKPDESDQEGLYSWPTSRLGWGSASGPERAIQAASLAIRHPLLEADQLRPHGSLSISIRAARKQLDWKDVKAAVDVVLAHCDPDISTVLSVDADDTKEDHLLVSTILVPKGDEKGRYAERTR